MDKVEQAFVEEKKQAWIGAVKQSKFAIGLLFVIVGILSWNIYRSSETVTVSEKFEGIVIGAHHVQRKSPPSMTMLSIKLDSGEVVMVAGPLDKPIRMNSEVEVIKGKTDQGREHYYFSAYKDKNELR